MHRHMWCTTGIGKLQGEKMCLLVHPSYEDRHLPDTWCVFCTLGIGQWYFVDPSLCIQYSVFLCSTKPVSLETAPNFISYPDPVYLIDFYPDGHLYNTKASAKCSKGLTFSCTFMTSSFIFYPWWLKPLVWLVKAKLNVCIMYMMCVPNNSIFTMTPKQ